MVATTTPSCSNMTNERGTPDDKRVHQFDKTFFCDPPHFLRQLRPVTFVTEV